MHIIRHRPLLFGLALFCSAVCMKCAGLILFFSFSLLLDAIKATTCETTIKKGTEATCISLAKQITLFVLRNQTSKARIITIVVKLEHRICKSHGNMTLDVNFFSSCFFSVCVEFEKK